MKKKLLFTFTLIFHTLTTYSQSFYLIAGNGTTGFSGDNGIATNSQLSHPTDVDVDSYGNVYFSDRDNHRIRKIDLNGIITTVAGTGVAGYSGDGSFAVNAQIHFPLGIKIDNNNNIYFVDNNNHCVRKINPNGIISTVAGNGSSGYTGDGGIATNAKLNSPIDIAIDNYNNLYIADSYNNRIRKVDTNGIITTIAGSGTSWFNVSGDGGQAINAEISYVTNIYFDNQYNNIFFTDWQNHLIRKIDSNGVISTIAGIGVSGFTGDNGPAMDAKLYSPTGLTSINGILYFADRDNNRIRKIDTNGIITTYAGGNFGCSTDGNLSDFNSKGISGLNYKNGVLYLTNEILCETVTKIIDASLSNDKILTDVLEIFPNPTHNIININSNKKINKIELYDLQGKLILKENETDQINISNLKEGVYFIKIYTNNGLQIKKIIKE